MNLTKSAMRYLALGFFVSGILLSGYGLLSPDSSLSAEEQSYKEKYETLLAEESSSADSVMEQPSDTTADSGETTSDESVETDSPEEEAVSEEENTADDPDQESATEPVSTVIVIESGDPSSFASNQLQNQGIIESAREFNTFLEENGYTVHLRPGSYEVNSDMNFEEIAQTLMDKN